MKKTMLLSLVLMMILAGFAQAQSGKPASTGGFVYSIQSDGSAQILYYMGQAEDLMIPSLCHNQDILGFQRRT